MDLTRFLWFLLLGYFLASPVNTIFHELGHALPALLFTKERVRVFFGSYGKEQGALKLYLGKLHLFFNPMMFAWSHGVAMPDGDMSTNQSILVTLMGPFTSVFVAVLILILNIYGEPALELQAFSVAFLLSAFVALVGNLYPKSLPDPREEGEELYSDGRIILELLQIKKIEKKYAKGYRYFERGEYQRSGDYFKGLLEKGEINDYYHQAAVLSFYKAGDLTLALEIQKEYEPQFERTSEFLTQWGIRYVILGESAEAIALFDEILQEHPQNLGGLRNRGYTLNLMGQFEKAIADFDMAIEVAPQFAYTYANRGLAYLWLGNEEQALADFHQAMELNPEEAYVHRNLGIYHLEKGRFDLARDHFEKARSFNPDTHLLEEYMAKLPA